MASCRAVWGFLTIVLLTLGDICCIKCYIGSLGETNSVKEEDLSEDGGCAMSLTLPCQRNVQVKLSSHTKVEDASEGCKSDGFTLRCDCHSSHCNGDMKDFKKMWESSPSYSSTSEETRCLLKAYYVAYPTTTIAPSTTTETSETSNTTTDSEGEMGQLQYTRKNGQNLQVERQFNRKTYYKEEEEEEKAAKREDMIMIIIFVCLCVIFVALVILAIVLVLTGPKDPMTKWKTRGKGEKTKRKK